MTGLMLLATAALARDDGRYANSPLKQCFESLESEFGQCCTNADGYVVSDPDWESDRGHYRGRMDGEWVLMPDGAVVTQPNRAGRTMAWTLHRRPSARPLFHARQHDVIPRFLS